VITDSADRGAALGVPLMPEAITDAP
jgi:hypothetical protein